MGKGFPGYFNRERPVEVQPAQSGAFRTSKQAWRARRAGRAARVRRPPCYAERPERPLRVGPRPRENAHAGNNGSPAAKKQECFQAYFRACFMNPRCERSRRSSLLRRLLSQKNVSGRCPWQKLPGRYWPGKQTVATAFCGGFSCSLQTPNARALSSRNNRPCPGSPP